MKRKSYIRIQSSVSHIVWTVMNIQDEKSYLPYSLNSNINENYYVLTQPDKAYH